MFTWIQKIIMRTAGISRYHTIARDFFDRIYGMDYDGMYVSDQADIWMFPFYDDEQELVTCIENTYNVDISDIEDGNIVKVLKRIDEKRRMQV
jgi:hypothetical protein